MKAPEVLFGTEYSTKVEKLDNYRRLCIADTKRQFARAVKRMKDNNFNVKTAHIVAKVDYLTVSLEFYYDAGRNEIIIADII